MSAFDEFFDRRLQDQPEHVADLAREVCEEIRATANVYLAMVELELDDDRASVADGERDAFDAGVQAGLLATMATMRRRRMLRGDTGEVQR